MNMKPQVMQEYFASCEICMKEIPVSEASSDEASDYVIYYFGLECYETWLEQERPGSGTTSE
jgi:hypothetical protein